MTDRPKPAAMIIADTIMDRLMNVAITPPAPRALVELPVREWNILFDELVLYFRGQLTRDTPTRMSNTEFLLRRRYIPRDAQDGRGAKNLGCPS